MRGCKSIQKLIRRSSHDEIISEQEQQRMVQHIAQCPRCQQVERQEQRVDTILATLLSPTSLQFDLSEEPARRTAQLAMQEQQAEPSLFASWRSYTPPRYVWVSALLVMLILIISTVTSLYLYSTQPMVVSAAVGSGIYRLAPGTTQWQLISSGTRIDEGDSLKTDQITRIEIRQGNRVNLLVNQNTHISFPSRATALGFLNLEQGEIYVELRAKPSTRYQMATPAGEVTPFGTTLVLQVDEHRKTTVAVLTGQVRFKNRAGSVVIPARHGSEAEFKEGHVTAPTAPETIDPGKVIHWVDTFRQLKKYPEKTRLKLATDAIRLGNELHNAQRYYDALTSYRRATELAPDWANGYMGLGIANFRLNRYQAAISAYTSALTLNPSLHSARYNLILSYLNVNRAMEALPHAEWLVNQLPNDHKFAMVLGEVYRHLGRLDDAEQWYRYGLTLSPCEECRKMANQRLEQIAQKRSE
ncbi:MAG: tetratricopeptide repeat protein [bacterium]|nr:tetratricopeptide repeat protein [bacterium]